MMKSTYENEIFIITKELRDNYNLNMIKDIGKIFIYLPNKNHEKSDWNCSECYFHLRADCPVFSNYHNTKRQCPLDAHFHYEDITDLL